MASYRGPGTLLGAGIPCVPYTAGCAENMGPSIHVHSPPLYSHRSLRKFKVSPVESSPNPPKIQTFPETSCHATGESRPPGVFPAAGTPCVPYTPCCSLEDPASHVHCPLLNF